MGMVMKEASNAIGGGGSDDKQSMMNGAAMTLTKLVAQNQLSSFIGGSNSGGLGMLGMGATVRVYCILRVHRFDAFYVVAQESLRVTYCSDVQCIVIFCRRCKLFDCSSVTIDCVCYGMRRGQGW